jgi:hypothetical protein
MLDRYLCDAREVKRRKVTCLRRGAVLEIVYVLSFQFRPSSFQITKTVLDPLLFKELIPCLIHFDAVHRIPIEDIDIMAERRLEIVRRLRIMKIFFLSFGIFTEDMIDVERKLKCLWLDVLVLV